MLFRSSILIIAINLVGTTAFTPSTYIAKSTPSTTALFDKKKTSAKKGARAKPKGFAGALRDLQMNAFPYAGTIIPGVQSPQKVVLDESIMKPDYALDGRVSTSLCVRAVVFMGV